MPKRFKIHRAVEVGQPAPELARPTTPQLLMARRLRSSQAWRKEARAGLEAEPLCFDPFDAHDQPTPAKYRHHVEPVWKRPDLLVDRSNGRSLCSACHGRIEAMERAGTDTRPLFDGVDKWNKKRPTTENNSEDDGRMRTTG